MRGALAIVGDVSSRPLILAVGLLIVLAIARLGRSPRQVRVIVTAAGVAGLVAYAAVAIWYASTPHFFDNAEPTMVAVGWLVHAGQPLYPTVDAAERYAHIYGPLAFVVHGIALGVLGPAIGVAKGVAALAALASLALTGVAVRRQVTASRAAVLTGLGALVLLMFRQYSFWVRPEPFLLVAVSTALAAAVAAPGPAAAVIVGVAAGALLNLKFTGPLYLLPVVVLLQRRVGWGLTFTAAALALVVAIVPFVAFGNVSPANYLAWIRLSSRTGLLLLALRQNLEWATYLGALLVIAYYAVPLRDRPHSADWMRTLGALLGALVACVVAGAKPGAGPYHLLPFLPIVTYLVAWQIANAPSSMVLEPRVAQVALAFVLAALIVAAAQQQLLVSTVMARAAIDDGADVRRFAETHRGRVEMGYGTTEALSFARPLLVFRNNAYLIDQPAVREQQLQGIALPTATLDAISSCAVDYWLIPRAEAPFSGRNSYTAVLAQPLYPDALRRAFDAAYVRTGTTAFYDVWQCRVRVGR